MALDGRGRCGQHRRGGVKHITEAVGRERPGTGAQWGRTDDAWQIDASSSGGVVARAVGGVLRGDNDGG